MWILILTLVINAEPPAIVSTVPNITSQADCERAAKQWEEKMTRGYYKVAAAVCVPAKEVPTLKLIQ
jgi:hypothetical protein